MHNVKRYFREGRVYFLTHVTYKRRPILVKNVDLLLRAFDRSNISMDTGFLVGPNPCGSDETNSGDKVGPNPCGSDSVTTTPALLAWCILPDHLHLLLEPGVADVSMLTRRFKLSFAALYRKRIGAVKGRVWHNRYWDHVIRDEIDLNRHIDYIHYNPVKHGMASRAGAYRHSSFGQYMSAGTYSENWATREDVFVGHDFGE
ncbi:MAG: transposase [bacterium]